MLALKAFGRAGPLRVGQSLVARAPAGAAAWCQAGVSCRTFHAVPGAGVSHGVPPPLPPMMPSLFPVVQASAGAQKVANGGGLSIWQAYADSLQRPEVLEIPPSVCVEIGEGEGVWAEIGEAEGPTDGGIYAIKRTYQPSTLKRKRTHGFRIRNRDARHILERRRKKGRHRLVLC